MTKTLVIHDANVDVRREFLAGDARIHGFVAIIVVSCCEELVAEVIDRLVFFREPASSQVSVKLGRT